LGISNTQNTERQFTNTYSSPSKAISPPREVQIAPSFNPQLEQMERSLKEKEEEILILNSELQRVNQSY
jgi:hypothetical protein